jgi:hypothetical protein
MVAAARRAKQNHPLARARRAGVPRLLLASRSVAMFKVARVLEDTYRC